MAQMAGAEEYTDCISPNECPGHDTKQSDGEAPVMLEFWWMRSTSLLSLLPGRRQGAYILHFHHRR